MFYECIIRFTTLASFANKCQSPRRKILILRITSIANVENKKRDYYALQHSTTTMAINTSNRQLPARTAAAVNHLRQLRPLDGYTAEAYLSSSGKKLVRLKRRNVPLKDDDEFLDIVVVTNRVIGIQILTASGHVGRGVVLVDENGMPSDDDSQITVDMTNVLMTASNINNHSSSARSQYQQQVPTTNPLLSNNIDNEMILQYGIMAFGALLLLKIVVNALSSLVLILLPFLYFYAASTCPTTESFDPKKELKRVMRGAHLPEEHQPKGFFEQGLNRLAASIST